MLSFGELCCFVSSYICVRICESESKPLVRSFNHLLSFSQNILNVQAEQHSGQVEVLLLITGQGYGSVDKYSLLCSGH
jgi:hypothetical protein